MTTVNVPSAEALKAFVARIERLKADKAAVGEDIKVVYAEAKAAGFVVPVLRNVIKRRRAKPADIQEAETLRDLYLDLLGMGRKEAPLFRHVGLMAVDTAARESVIEALKQLVPAKGEIIVKAGGQPVRLFRDKAGKACCEDYQEPRAPVHPAPAPGAASKPPRAAPPDCSHTEAVEMGRQAARDNKPVIDNPFPYDHPWRARWDEGWRKETGSDGMGPADEDD